MGVDGGADVVAHAGIPVGDAVSRHPLGLDQLIAPLQGDGVLGHHVVGLGVVVDHIRPEHDLLAIGGLDVVVELVQPLHEDHVLALLTAVLLDLVAAQAVGFVQADVDVLGVKIGQQGLVQVAHELEALRQEDVQRGGHLVLVFKQAQVVEVGLFQPGVHMAEGVLVGHQVDEALLAVLVQLKDVLGGEAVEIRRLLGVGGVLEAVALHVQLELVVLQRRQEVDHHLDRLHAGLLAAADVDHVAAAGQGGLVLNDAAGQISLLLAEHLLQGGRGAEEALVAGRGDRDALRRHRDAVFLPGQRGLGDQRHAGDARLQAGIHAGQILLAQGSGQLISAFKQLQGLGLGEDHHKRFLLVFQRAR